MVYVSPSSLYYLCIVIPEPISPHIHINTITIIFTDENARKAENGKWKMFKKNNEMKTKNTINLIAIC